MFSFSKKITVLPLVLSVMICLISGCFKLPVTEEIPLSEVQNRFIEICETEYDMPVVLKRFPHTLWIYVPLDYELFGYKGTQPKDYPAQAKEKPALNYIEVRYDAEQKAFVVDYDISTARQYPKDPGYTSTSEDKYVQAYRRVYNTISQTFLNVETPDKKKADITFGVEDRSRSFRGDDPEDEKAGDDRLPVDEKDLPEFIVLIFADVTHGVAVKAVFALEDYKKQVRGFLSHEEAGNRTISEIYGNENIIGDLTGQSVEYKDITRPAFMAMQIKNRIKQKYERSEFPPSMKSLDEIKLLTAQTLQYFKYTDYDEVIFNDLGQDTRRVVSRDRIEKIDIEPPRETKTISVDMKNILNEE